MLTSTTAELASRVVAVEARMAEQDETRQDETANVPSTEPPTPQMLLDEARSLADEERRRAETYLDLAQRAQADFQNYKRRVEGEREKLVRDANADLLRQVLPVLDDLERALAHVPGELAEHSWAQGVQMIGTKLGGILEGQGLERIGTEGEAFDPYVHEAVAYETHPEYDEGQVAAVYRPGYRLHERVLRPAQVTVARAPLIDNEKRPSAAFDGAPGTRG